MTDTIIEPREGEDVPFTPPPVRPWWPWALALTLSLALLATAAWWFWPEQDPPLVVEVVAPPRVAPRQDGMPPREAASHPASVPTTGPRKCVKGGQVTYTDGDCPLGSEVSVPDLAPSVQSPDTSGRKHITLYHCRSSAGQFFWSRKTCSEWGARLERMTGVPEGWSFERQVALAEQRRREAVSPPAPATAARPVAPVAPGTPAPNDKIVECQRLEREIANIDSLARQVLDFRQQDRLRASRQQARDRQFALGCGRS